MLRISFLLSLRDLIFFYISSYYLNRYIHDKLVGSDILVVSGDLVSQESISTLADLHRANAAGLTLLLSRPAFDLDNLQVMAATFCVIYCQNPNEEGFEA
jgi:hypothetical protein